MGFLDKIFNTPIEEPVSQEKEVDSKELLPQALTVAVLREKYKRMEGEGKKVNWWEYERSINLHWPYPVATEAERDHIEQGACQVLRGHAPDIMQVISDYTVGLCENYNDDDMTIWKDEDKANYWKQILVTGAELGNRAYQASLITDNGYGGKHQGWISEEEYETFERMYRDSLLRDAESGDPDAQYAVAEFCLGDAKYGTDLRRTYADNAMHGGVTDAAYLRGEIYKSDAYLAKENWEYEEVLKFYRNAVDNSEGSMLGYMQDCIADAYRDGEGDFPVDKGKAVYYYNLAVKNGSSSAKSTLELAENSPEFHKAVYGE